MSGARASGRAWRAWRARVPTIAAAGLSALTLAILIGAVLGHFGHRAVTGPATQPELIFAQKTLLRIGVALYGLNVCEQVRRLDAAVGAPSR